MLNCNGEECQKGMQLELQHTALGQAPSIKKTLDDQRDAVLE
jgi:hypothetical protein